MSAIISEMRFGLRFHLMLVAALFALRAAAAPGDILSVEVETNGWVLEVAIQGAGTNGAYNFGLGTNNTLTGGEKVKVTVTSMGFNDTGAPTTVQRIIYGTFALRFPYPNQAYRTRSWSPGC